MTDHEKGLFSNPKLGLARSDCTAPKIDKFSAIFQVQQPMLRPKSTHGYIPGGWSRYWVCKNLIFSAGEGRRGLLGNQGDGDDVGGFCDVGGFGDNGYINLQFSGN